MPLVGFAVRFGSGTGETFPRSDRVMAAQCPLGDWYLLSKRRSRWPGRSAGCRPAPSNRARQKARQPASPRPRTRSSNLVPSSRESTNLRSLGVRLLAGSYLSVSNRNTAGLGSGSEDSKHVEGEQLVGIVTRRVWTVEETESGTRIHNS
jgi:hypothetical protein